MSARQPRWLPEGLPAFLLVGGVGFLVDALVLNTLIFSYGWGYYTARVASFGVAVVVTWLLNRNWTFRHRRSANRGREYRNYLLVQSCGALINFAAYSACIWVGGVFRAWPVLALAVGSVLAMGFNFLAARRYVFTGKSEIGRA